MADQVNFTLFPAFDGYIGKVTLPTSVKKTHGSKIDVDTLVIMDTSASMGDNVQKLICKVIPNVFSSLHYKESDKITIITFNDFSETYTDTIENFRKSKITCSGTTQMRFAINSLKGHLEKSANKYVRILALSDGDLHDQDLTVKESALLVPFTSGKYINSQAIRFFTSSAQPDTRGLSSILQLNTTTEARLIDIKGYDNINETIASLFVNDGLDKDKIILKSETPVFMNSPWETPLDTLIYRDEIFFLKEIPKNVTLNNKSYGIKFEFGSPLSFDNFDVILKDKIDYYINRLKVLKVLNTEHSSSEISSILNYFSNLEKTLGVSDLMENTSLRARSQYYKNLINKRKKSVVIKMAEIANDEKVSKLNSAQQADYLRTMNISKNAKALAKRALNHDIDFDAVVKKEVRAMHSHISELSKVNDKDHFVSFYSKETTLGGIRATCELVDNGMLDDMNAQDILTLINIVGVSCNATIGDFPDPMTWRVDNIFPGCYLSLSDLLMAHLTSGGTELKAVGIDKVITNVIPIYDDEKVHKFLLKYAPCILEYSASIGMRRIIANVSWTYSYTLCAGVWKMIQELNNYKSDLNVLTFSKLALGYELAVGTNFDHVLEFVKDQDENLSYYIANNGVTNMIAIIMKLVKMGGQEKYLVRIMRALYSYEINQAIRRKFKNLEHHEHLMVKALNDLLGIDLEKNKVILKPFFEENSDIVFYDKYHVNDIMLKEFISYFWYIDYMTLLPEFLIGARQTDPIVYIKKIPKMDEKTICSVLEIDYDLNIFKLFNIVQSMLCNTKSQRVDSDNHKMLIQEINNNFSKSDMFVKDYVKKQYVNKYSSDYAHKMKAEKDEMCRILVEKMVGTESVSEFVRLFKEGVMCGSNSHKISNKGSLGFVILNQNLLDMGREVFGRIEKLKILLLGRDSVGGNIVWNNGNTLGVVGLRDYADLFKKLDCEKDWKPIAEEFAKSIYMYRATGGIDVPNRHGHSNGKPSYWAYGFETIEAFAKDKDTEEWNEYKRVHHDCCGVSRLNF